MEKGAWRPLEIAGEATQSYSDLAVARALASAEMGGGSREAAREARIVASALDALSFSDAAAPLEPAQLSDLTGLGRASVDEAVGLLVQAGVLEIHQRSGGARAVLTDTSRQPTTSEALPWSEIVFSLAGEPAAQLLARVIARHAPHPSRWVELDQASLARDAGYSRATTVHAIGELARRGIIDVDERKGRRHRYRLSGRAGDVRLRQERGRGATSPQGATRMDRPEPVDENTEGDRGASRNVLDEAGEGIHLVVGGVRVHLAPGTHLSVADGVAVTIGLEDGEATIRIEPR